MNTFKPVEVTVSIDVSRVPMMLDKISFRNLQQSTNVTMTDVAADNLPAGMSTSYTVSYYDGDAQKTLTELDAIDADRNVTVKVAMTYDNDIYDLVSSGDEGSYVFWNDGAYNTENGADSVSKVRSGYTVESVTRNGSTVTVVLTHTLEIRTPRLELVEITGDSVTYDGNFHGFTMNNVPAGSTITVTPWKGMSAEAGANGDAMAPQTLTAAAAGKDAYTDLRQVALFSALVQNAGTYYYQVKIDNEAYDANEGGAAYTAYVTVQIDKATVAIPSPVNATYDRMMHSGYVETDDYTVGGTHSTEWEAGGYYSTLTLKDPTNYRWEGKSVSESAVELHWQIYKMTVAIPSVDETKRKLPYNGQYQTPLIFANVDTVAEDGAPQPGEYKYEVKSDDRKIAVVYVYLKGEWCALYEIYGAFGLATGTSYGITGNIYSTQSGLLDSANFQWPYGQTQLSLGTWIIEKSEIELPTFNVPAAEYTGAPYAGTPALAGSWDAVNADGLAAFDHDAELDYIYYSALGAELKAPPTEVGTYTVKVDVKDALEDQANYTLPADTTVTGKLQIIKGQLTLTDQTVEQDYTGQTVTLPAPGYLDSTGEEFVLPDGESLTLRYYPAVGTEIEVENPETGEKEKQTLWEIDTTSEGSTVNTIQDKKGEYHFFVGVDEMTPHYASVNYALITLTILESEQSITVTKKDQNASPRLTPVKVNQGTEEEPEWVTTGYTLEANLGDEPLELNVRGEKDVQSALTFAGAAVPQSGVSLGSGEVQYNTTAVTGGGAGMKLAFLGTTPDEGYTVTLHAAGTDNAGEATVPLTIKVARAVPNVEVSVTPASHVYNGECPFTFSTTVTGKTPYDLDGTPQAAIGNPDTTGDYNNCRLYFYKQPADAEEGVNVSDLLANAETLFTQTDFPTEEGIYWVSARYNGDTNYGQTYSVPATFTIGAAEMTAAYGTAVSKTYDGEGMALLSGLKVTGVVPGEDSEPKELTQVSSADALAEGKYLVEYTDNVNVGSAGITATGKGSYAGLSVTAAFAITPADLANAVVAEITNQAVTGSAVEPGLTVTFGGRTLTRDVDYTAEYSSNTGAGTAHVTLTGIGDFTGTNAAEFKIVSSGGGGGGGGFTPTPTPPPAEPLPGEGEQPGEQPGEQTEQPTGETAGFRECPHDVTCPMTDFHDLKLTAWYHDGVHYCLDHKLMKGVGSGRFQPLGTTTRAEVATVLWRLCGSPKVASDIAFTDVPSGKFYTEAVRWGEESGVIKGISSTQFDPNASITREDFATMMYRFARLLGKDLSVGEGAAFSSYADASSVHKYARAAMEWACSTEIVTGDRGELRPRANATRAEMATMLMRFCILYELDTEK